MTQVETKLDGHYVYRPRRSPMSPKGKTLIEYLARDIKIGQRFKLMKLSLCIQCGCYNINILDI